MKSERMKQKEVWWRDINEWTDTTQTDTGAEFQENILGRYNVDDMYQECVRFEGWTHASESSKIPGAWPKDARDVPEVRWDGNEFTLVLGEWKRWLAEIDSDNFPTIHKFLEENDQYERCVLSKLAPGAVILPHVHGPTDGIIYNLCLNFPEGCMFAVYPTGLVPYEAGDIYKLHTHNCTHSVINNSDADRFHIMMRPKRDVQEIS